MTNHTTTNHTTTHSSHTNKALIYVIEDEADIATLIADALRAFGFRVTTFPTGRQALQAIQQQPADVCIIDLGLPDMDGLTCIRELSANTDTGLVVLTGRDSLTDRVLGLELGADDYITKPFDSRELVARISRLVRRLAIQPQPGTCSRKVARIAHWQFDPATLLLSHDNGDNHNLSSGEANLLMSLLRSPNRILSREQLISDQTIPYDRSIDSRMSRLRKKLEQNPRQPVLIKTVYGAGYMLAGRVEWRLLQTDQPD
tara:strand:- start:831 stop:1604 length:774 start_codon:yes stop_codon:yes gene_type:complete